VFGSYASRQGESEGSGRTALYATIAVAVLALAAGAYWMLSRRPAAKPAPAPQATALPTAAPVVVPTAAPTVDAKKVEEEVQRQLAQKKKEMQKALEAERKQAARPTEPPPAEVIAEPAVAPSAVPAPPTEAPTEPPPPTAVPTRLPPTQAPPSEPEVRRGDLVGPGPGVVEPEMVSKPKVVYPAIARQQGAVTGRVVVLVLVDEDGAVAETRLQQGVAPKSGINEAVLDAVKKVKFRPATKSGVPVKMWRPVVVDVKP
jgi:TonB family protein